MYDRGAWFLRVITLSSRALCCPTGRQSVKTQKDDFQVCFVNRGRHRKNGWRQGLTKHKNMPSDREQNRYSEFRGLGNTSSLRKLFFESLSAVFVSSCRRIPHFIVLFSSGQRWLLVRGVAMGLCRRCVIFMSSCPRTLLPCHLATLLPCYPVTLLPCYPFTLLSCYPVILLPCSLVTLLPFYPVTFLPFYLVTQLPRYPVILLPCYLVTLLTCYLVNLFPSYLVTMLPCYPVPW